MFKIKLLILILCFKEINKNTSLIYDLYNIIKQISTNINFQQQITYKKLILDIYLYNIFYILNINLKI